MESYEKKSDEVESQADQLEGEGERVDRQIEELKSDVQAKHNMPGMDPGEEPVPAEAADEGDEPNAGSVD